MNKFGDRNLAVKFYDLQEKHVMSGSLTPTNLNLSPAPPLEFSLSDGDRYSMCVFSLLIFFISTIINILKHLLSVDFSLVLQTLTDLD